MFQRWNFPSDRRYAESRGRAQISICSLISLSSLPRHQYNPTAEEEEGASRLAFHLPIQGRNPQWAEPAGSTGT